jgi:hypothetical protein
MRRRDGRWRGSRAQRLEMVSEMLVFAATRPVSTPGRASRRPSTFQMELSDRPACVGINHWFGMSRPIFEIL